MSNRTVLPFKYLVLIGAMIFGAWFHFEWAAVILISYIVAALLFDFNSKTSLTAGLFLIFARFFFSRFNPVLAIDPKVQDLQIYGFILVVFWLAVIIDKRVTIAIVGEEGALKQPKKIIIESALDKTMIKKAAVGSFQIIQKSFASIFGAIGRGAIDLSNGIKGFYRKSFEGLKQAPSLVNYLWATFKLLCKLAFSAIRRLGRLIDKAIQKTARLAILIVKKTADLTVLIIRKTAVFFWKIVVWIFKSFVEFWISLFKFLTTKSKLRSVIFKTLGLIIFSCLLVYFTKLALFEIFVWVFFVAGVIFKFDSRVSIGFALILLLICPFMLMQKETQPLAEKVAEMLAVYAYYFLVIGVVLQMMEYVQEGRKGKMTEC